MRILYQLLLMLFFPVIMYAETNDSLSHYSLGVSAGAFYMLGRKDAGVNLVKKHNAQFYSIYIDYQTCNTDSNTYDRVWGYPIIEGGLYFGDISHIRLSRDYSQPHYLSDMGYSVIAYAAFKRNLMQNSKFCIGYDIENGVSYNTKPYNRYSNVDNEFTGSRISAYIGLGFYASYKFDNGIVTGLSLDFKHLSNGGLDRPNKGANFIGMMTKTTFPINNFRHLCNKNANIVDKSLVNESFTNDCNNVQVLPIKSTGGLEKKYGYVDISMLFGGKTLLEEWVYNYYEIPKDNPSFQTAHYDIHCVWGGSIAPMYRYSKKYASGIGLDYSYATYANRVLEIDRLRGQFNTKSDKHVLGISLKHECFYKQMSLCMSLGYYLHRKMGYMAEADEKMYYETIGFKWYPSFLHNKFYVGYNVKAHLMKADRLEIRLGSHLFKKI